MIGRTAPLKDEIAQLRARLNECETRIDDLQELLSIYAIKNLELRGEMAKMRKDLFEAQSRGTVTLPIYDKVQPV